jgi:hypothetical protein
MSEEEVDMVAVRCLRLFNVLVLLLGAGLTGLALWSGRSALDGIGTSLAYAIAAVGATITMMTVVGLVGAVRRSSTLLVVYFTWLIILGFAMLLLGGLSFVFTDGVASYLKNNWSILSSALPASQRTEGTLNTLMSNVKWTLRGMGAICFLLLSMILGAISSVVRLVTPIRAYSLLLQANNVSLLPVGVALIGVATYIADTAVGVEGPTMAYAIFVIGILLVVLTMLGCTGVSLRSRGLLRMLSYTTGILSLAFLCFGIASLAISTRVVAYIVSNWSELKRVLPAGFSGKYDQAQFAAFVSNNLSALGFFTLCTFVIMALQAWASMRLRTEIRCQAVLEAEAMDAVQRGLISAEDGEAIKDMHSASSPLETMWKAAWTNGTPFSRCAVRAVFVAASLVVVAIVGVATAALYYQTSCSNIERWSANKVFMTDVGPYAYVVNNVSRGSIILAVGTASGVQVAVRKAAFKEEYALAEWPVLSSIMRMRALNVLGGGSASATSWTYTAASVTAIAKAPTKIIGVDTSCQQTSITLSLPRAGLLGGNSRAASDANPLAFELVAGGAMNGVVVDWSGFEPVDRPRIRRLDAYAQNGPIELTALNVGSKGMSLTAVSGQVELDRVSVTCDPEDAGGAVGTGGLVVSSNYGGISATGVELFECDAFLTGTAASTFVTLTTSASHSGSSRFFVSSSLGTVDISSSIFDNLIVAGDGGVVRLRNVTANGGLKVSTADGAITLAQLFLGSRATVQVESDKGDITVDVSSFSGIVSVVTAGTISCEGKGFAANACGASAVSREVASNGDVVTVLEQANVNCGTTCAYMGSLAITSARGNIVLTIR